MRVKQALVAVGGQGLRLRQGGVDVPLTKSFLELRGRPLLYWSLLSLWRAGVRRLVIAGNEQIHLQATQQVVDVLPCRFESIALFRDAGKGFHGLPFAAKHLLGKEFFFECGHAITPVEHLRRMDKAKADDAVVFSAFHTHPNNPRLPPVVLDGERVVLPPDGQATGIALATPFLIDQKYAEALPGKNFSIVEVIRDGVQNATIRAVLSDSLPEFDIVEEYILAKDSYIPLTTQAEHIDA